MGVMKINFPRQLSLIYVSAIFELTTNVPFFLHHFLDNIMRHSSQLSGIFEKLRLFDLLVILCRQLVGIGHLI